MDLEQYWVLLDKNYDINEYAWAKISADLLSVIHVLELKDSFKYEVAVSL